MARKFGGMFFYGAENLNLEGTKIGVAASTANWVRNGLGDVSINNTAGAQTYNIWCGIADCKRPYFTFQYPGISAVQPTSNEFQEIFGTAAGGPSNPFSGGATSPQFEVPPLPWGIAVVDIFAVYSLQVAAATTATLGLSRVTFTENAVFTNTALIAATGVSVATNTGAGTPHVQTVAATNPLVFEINNFSNLIIELQLVLPATTTMRVYGLGMHVAVCYD